MNALKLAVLLCALLTLPARAEPDPVLQPVVDVFAGLSAFDYERMRGAVTADFLLLEHGEVWDMEILIDKIPPSDRVRRNFFSEISRHVSGDVALVNYWNRAEVSSGRNDTTLAWLESVVLVKRDGRWVMQQMHSTRVEPGNLPKGLSFVEMK